MIIFAKANGTVVETNPTPFYQGSSLNGSIYLVAPFPNTNGVTIQFQLPNGNVTKAYPMTPTGEVEGVMLDGYEVSAWTWDVKNAMVTAIPGVVTATIKVIDTDDNVTSIVSSFSIIKGTPNALDPSTPSASEWQAIISALGSIGGKVTMPLMTNFTYNIATGESEKTYNNGMVQTENFPAVLPDTMTGYQSFTKTTFESTSWVNSDRGSYSHMLVIGDSTIKPNEDFGFDIAVFRLISNTLNTFEKMDPFIVVDFDDSNVKIYSNVNYNGYVLFFWKGSFIEQNYLPSIEKAKLDAEVATSQAEIATERANSISQTLADAYENGEFGIPSGGTVGQVLTKTENGTAWQNASSGGANFSYYSLKPYEDYANGTMACVPNLVDIQKIEIDSYIMKANIFTGSGTSPFVKVFDSSIGLGGANILYENGVKNDISFVIDYIESRIYWDIGSSLILPTRIDTGSYDSYNVHEIILKIYPKEA